MSKAIALLALLSSACSGFQWQPCERLAVAGEIADVATTALAVGQPGARELNPLIGHGDQAEVIASAALVKLGVHALIHHSIEKREARNASTRGRDRDGVCTTWTTYGAINAAVAGLNLNTVKDTKGDKP